MAVLSPVSNGQGYGGGYGKIALGGYAGPPAAEQVTTADTYQTVAGSGSALLPSAVRSGLHLPCKPATVS